MTQLIRVLNDYKNLMRTDVDSWLPPDEIKSDAFGEFQTRAGKLSVFRLEHSVSLDRVLAAYSLRRNKFRDVDYAIIDRDVFAGVGATFDPTAIGDTPDLAVNKVHENVHIITGRRLLDLIGAIWQPATRKLDRCSKKELWSAIADGYRAGYWRSQDITNPETQKALKKIIPALTF